RSDKFVMDLTEAEIFALDDIEFSDDRWVSIPQVQPGQPGYEIYEASQKCLNNQARRMQLKAEISEFQSTLDQDGSKMKEAVELIAREIGAENSIPVANDAFMIEFLADGNVQIRVTNFNKSGITQRSYKGEHPIRDVSFRKNRLYFTIPGVGENAGTDYR